MLNVVTYLASIGTLLRLGRSELRDVTWTAGRTARLRDGIKYMIAQPNILWPTILGGLFAVFTINMATTLAAYTKVVFHSGAGGYALLNSLLASGSLVGALISARLARTRLRTLISAAYSVALMQVLASITASLVSFCAVLIGLGVSLMLFLISESVTVQLAAVDSVRGRVLGINAVVYFAGGSLGGPIVGWLDEQLGPRMGILLGGLVSAVVATLVGFILARSSHAPGENCVSGIA
jgi:MFS family permease